MLSTPVRAIAAYQEVQVTSRSPLELVVMLYDGALVALEQARAALDAGDLVAKREAMSRSFAILGQLQSSLNLEAGGEVAARLDALYGYLGERLTAANVQCDVAPVAEAIHLLSVLREGWVAISAPPLEAAS
jgi:flagellar secretion chaperone FliS